MKEIADLLTRYASEGKRILVLSHFQADPDGVGSSVVLSEVLRKLGAKAEAGAPEGISKLTQLLLEGVKKEVNTSPSLNADLVVMVDTSSFGHLGKLGEELERRKSEVVLLDHHKEVEGMRNKVRLFYVDENTTSSAELVLRLTREMGVELTPDQAFLLLAGIVTDTGGLKFARNSTFEAIYELIKAGADYPRVVEATKLPEDRPKRIAMIKAAQRAELRIVHDHIVVFSDLSSFEGDAAAMFVKMGADVALVGSEEKGTFRISGRARPEVCENTRLHLGALMQEVAKRFGGTGGGHPGAASATGRGDLGRVKKFVALELKKTLEP